MSTDCNKAFWSRIWSAASPERTSAFVAGFDMSEDIVIHFLKQQHALHICDAGCGCGIYSLKLSRFGFCVSGFDIAEDAVSLTKALLSENGYQADGFRQAEILSTGYEDSCFDAVIARDVIDHMPIKQGIEAVNELLRITRPGGCILLTLDTTDSEYESEPHETNDDGDYIFHRGKWNGMVFHPYSFHDIGKLANGKPCKILSANDSDFIVLIEKGE